MDNIFSILNWVLKKTKKHDLNFNCTSVYMLNRWLSMSDPSVANIVNVTSNRWMCMTNFGRNLESVSKFYYKIIPRFNSKINYIKKPEKKTEDSDLLSLARSCEKSTRELEILNKALVNLQTKDI